MPIDSLRGRVAIVSGAGSGIGRATANLLAERGAVVVFLDRDGASAEEAASEASRRGGLAEAIRGDVCREADWRRVVEDVEGRHGRIDLLFNNAGYAIKKPIVEMSEAEFLEVLQVLLVGTFLGCRAVIPAMLRAGGGAIVNNASSHGLLGFPSEPDYAAAKGGVISLTRQLAVDYARHGIRVNCVCPGPVRTPRMERQIAAGRTVPGESLAAVPMGRYAKPEEVAAVVAFLLSDEASYVTGVALPVDGGQTGSRRLPGP